MVRKRLRIPLQGHLVVRLDCSPPWRVLRVGASGFEHRCRDTWSFDSAARLRRVESAVEPSPAATRYVPPGMGFDSLTLRYVSAAVPRRIGPLVRVCSGFESRRRLRG